MKDQLRADMDQLGEQLGEFRELFGQLRERLEVRRDQGAALATHTERGM